MVRTGQLQKQDVKQEGTTAHALAHWLGTERNGRHGVPDRDVCRDVDLLRRVTEGPPDRPVNQRVNLLDNAHGHQEGGNQDDRTRRDREHRDNRCRDCPESHQRHGTCIGFVALGYHQCAKEYEAGDQRTYGEQDQPQVKARCRHHGDVARHHHAGTALENGDIVGNGTNEHQRKCQPRNFRCSDAASQQSR